MICKTKFLKKYVKNDNKSLLAYVRSKQDTIEKVEPIKDSLGSLITKDKDVFTLEDIQNIPEQSMIFKGDIDKRDSFHLS